MHDLHKSLKHNHLEDENPQPSDVDPGGLGLAHQTGASGLGANYI